MIPYCIKLKFIKIRNSLFHYLIKQRLKNAFTLTSDLLESMDETNLKLKINDVPSNTIGGQYWCIIGARQSYNKAMEHDGEWQGFLCELEDPHNKEDVIKLLELTSKGLDDLKIDEKNERVMTKLLELLEHEIQHHGQLIRFVYANKLKFPESWNRRYTV